jgi:hypothetical protein
LPHYEFKQGLLSRDSAREFNESPLNIVRTICGMANIEPARDSYIYLGVCDKDLDAVRVKLLDGIDPIEFKAEKWLASAVRERSLALGWTATL